MRDSQRQTLRAYAGKSISKANNERFSTQLAANPFRYKYIKGE